MSYVETFLAAASERGDRGQIRKRFQCADGFAVSIQASSCHYCSPREDYGPWDQVELAYPSEVPTPEVLEYAESPNNPTGTVYGYVPVELVDALIDAHGGPGVTP